MISVNQALSIISSVAYTPTLKTVAISESNGLQLSKDIISPIHMPPFRQSAMDGYALSIHNENTYEIIGEVKAGDNLNYQLKPGQGVRIFTGAKVPDSANTVVIQEKISKSENNIILQEKAFNDKNIRPVGEQIKKGEIALKKHTILTPAGLGFIAGLGINKVTIYAPPRIAIITTGNELVQPGNELIEGKIYESNSIQLESALEQLRVKNVTKYLVQDDYQNTLKIIDLAIKNNDLVLISGGISVGDYDFVKQALLELHTEELFYKVKQKPGKPLFFGKNNKTFIFALPGNPASSLTCFYIYVVPIIKKMMGISYSGLKRSLKKISTAFIKKGDRAQFLKAIATDQTVEVLEGQSSAMLHTFAIANALVYIPEEISKIEEGSFVETILLPNYV